MSAAQLAEKTHKLRHARYLYGLKHFPAYAELVAKHTGASESALKDIPFDQLPILSKSKISQIQSSFRAFRDFRGSNLIPHSTGGSTGQPFKFNITRESYEWRTAASDRGYSWAQAEEGQRSFYVWGTAITPPSPSQKLKANIHHWLQNRKYFDSFHFDDAAKAECCRQINAFKPVSLVGYAGNLIEFARFVGRNPGILKHRAKTGVTAAEGLRPGMRELIEKHLVDELFMSYGSREFMLIGMECSEHQGYHISSDNLYVEVVDDEGRPCEPGEVGRIVVTDLHNDATPFVRYAIGDLGTTESTEGTERECKCGAEESLPSPSDSPQSTLSISHAHKFREFREFRGSNAPQPPCSCGLPFPLLKSVEGRLQEVIVRADGEKLTALFIPHLMKEFEWVDGYQVVQGEMGKMVMNLVTTDMGWEGKTKGIAAELHKKLGEDMDIRFERVERLEKTASGKTPIVLNHGKHGRHGKGL